MVPLKLRLRNFMAYRELDPPLDFTGIHIACLSGPNGSGKSALLDAMTWALWGQARAKSDDDLITLGQREMEVELEFALEEARYRVLRKRTRPALDRAGHSVLELQIADGEDFFRPITGNTLRETERAIHELLRLDYQTFINSSLLLQGRADEFTLKTPAERKRVLGEVLGLSNYDQLEERAKDEARRREMDVAVLQREISGLETEAAQWPELEAALEASQLRHQELQELTQAREQALTGLQQSRDMRREKEVRLVEARERARQAEGELRELSDRKGSLATRLTRYRGILEQRSNIENTLQEYQTLFAESEALNKALQALLSLQREESELERQLAAARHEVEVQAQLLESNVAALREQAAARESLEQRQQAAQAQLDAVEAQSSEVASGRTRIQEMVERLSVLGHVNEGITQQGKGLRAKVDQLRQPGAIGVCPLCGTELGPDGHQRIVDEYEAELDRQRQLYRANDLEIRQLQEARQQQEQMLQQLEGSIAVRQREAQGLLATLARELESAERAAQQLPEAERRLAQLQTTLTDANSFPEIQGGLRETKSRIAALHYDRDRRQAVQQRMKALEPALAALEELREADRELPNVEGELSRIQEAQARWAQRLTEAREHVLALQQEIASLPSAEQDISAAQQELETTKGRLQEIGMEVARLQVAIERSKAVGTVLQSQRRELAGRQEELGLYNELAVAFGQRGVQALLIEAALPEIEEDTNELLGRMTDNRLHVSLQTQRQLRTGNVRETLDIIIADELGTRAYEMYSGGEAFRVNFALRIALSKLLARRAGVGLPTLIIDEGFGTQDVAGREKLIEAINAIAEYFQRVLVITHMEDLKDAFPVRIEVTKTVDGSKAQVVYA